MKDWKQQKVHGLVTIYYTNLFFFSDLFSARFLVKWYCKGHFLVLFFNLMMMFFIIWQFDWWSSGTCPRFELGRDFAREGVSVFHFPFPTTYPFVHFLFATRISLPFLIWTRNSYIIENKDLWAAFFKGIFHPEVWSRRFGGQEVDEKNSQAQSKRPSPTKKKKKIRCFTEVVWWTFKFCWKMIWLYFSLANS